MPINRWPKAVVVASAGPHPQANNPKMVEALEFVVGLTNDGLTPQVEIGGGDRLQGFFTSSKLGMTSRVVSGPVR